MGAGEDEVVADNDAGAGAVDRRAGLPGAVIVGGLARGVDTYDLRVIHGASSAPGCNGGRLSKRAHNVKGVDLSFLLFSRKLAIKSLIYGALEMSESIHEILGVLAHEIEHGG